MITCTPVLAGRKLPGLPPDTPFLSSASAARDNTPLIKGMMLRGNGDTESREMRGIIIKKPNMVKEDSKMNNNPLGLP
jgi:hypothetical protein